VVRVDNTKTAVVQGAGAWGTINPSYQRYATTVRFHIDACAPYAPEHAYSTPCRSRFHAMPVTDFTPSRSAIPRHAGRGVGG
jgi:hypothetical protein